MTASLPRWFAFLWLALPFFPTAAAEPDDKEIERLVKQLGSDKFKEREAATTHLKEIGEPALADLRKALASDDLEVRLRASRLIEAIAARLQVFCYEGHTARVMGVVFSPDGRRLLSSSNDGTVRLIDAGTGKLIRTLAHPSARSVAFSPDGKKAVSTGEVDDQTMRH